MRLFKNQQLSLEEVNSNLPDKILEFHTTCLESEHNTENELERLSKLTVHVPAHNVDFGICQIKLIGKLCELQRQEFKKLIAKKHK